MLQWITCPGGSNAPGGSHAAVGHMPQVGPRQEGQVGPDRLRSLLLPHWAARWDRSSAPLPPPRLVNTPRPFTLGLTRGVGRTAGGATPGYARA